MFPYFAVSLAIRRFSNVLKESRYRNKFSIIKLTCNLFLFLGCGSHLANVTVNRAKAVLDTSLKISEHDNWYMPGSDAKHFWYVKDVVIPILLATKISIERWMGSQLYIDIPSVKCLRVESNFNGENNFLKHDFNWNISSIA